MKRLAVFHLSLLLSAIPTPAQDKTRIVALENSWNQAELHNDAHAVDLLLADDFVMTVADGYTLNKAAMLASVRDTSYRPDALQSDNMEVHMYGNTAIVTGSYLEKGKDKGKPFERRGRFTDTWINLAGQWRCVASHFSVKPSGMCSLDLRPGTPLPPRTTLDTYPSLQGAGILVGSLARKLT